MSARVHPAAAAYCKALPVAYRGRIDRRTVSQAVAFGIHVMHYRIQWDQDGRVTMAPEADNAWKEWARRDQDDHDAWQAFEAAVLEANGDGVNA